MSNKNTKTIVVVVLALAGLLGVVAVGTALYYSTIDDVSPGPTGADLGQNKCNEVYLRIKDPATEIWIDPPAGEPVNIDQPLLIGAEFQTAIEEASGTRAIEFKEFRFTINNSNDLVYIVSADDPENPIRTETLAGFEILYPEFEFNEWEKITEGTTSLTIDVVPYGEALDGELEPLTSVQRCLPVIFELTLEPPDIPTNTCIEAGQTQTDFCANLEPGKTCTIPVPSCCEGLVRVDNCSIPDSNDQCPVEIPNCFICLTSINDGQCNEEEGENVCNSPEDCQSEVEPNDPDDPPVDPPDPPVCTPDCNGLQCGSDGCGGSCGTCTGTEECISGLCTSEPPDPPEPPEPINTTSAFTVAVGGATCVERISPNNQVTLEITITNGDTTYEDLLQVVNKLPLGFTYVAGSTTINGVQDTNDQYTTVQTVGSAQEITWTTEDGWSIAANDNMVFEFKAIAGANAITGEVQNEVVITPLNNPVNTEALRAELVFNVAQSCTTPQTSIVGDIPIKVLAGSVAILISFLFYATSLGDKVAEDVLASVPGRVGKRVVRSAKMAYLRVAEPRTYFEKRFADRDRKSR